jgi:hypothetical protein
MSDSSGAVRFSRVPDSAQRDGPPAFRRVFGHLVTFRTDRDGAAIGLPRRWAFARANSTNQSIPRAKAHKSGGDNDTYLPCISFQSHCNYCARHSSALDVAKHFIGPLRRDAAHKGAQRQRPDAALADVRRSVSEAETMVAAELSVQCDTESAPICKLPEPPLWRLFLSGFVFAKPTFRPLQFLKP